MRSYAVAAISNGTVGRYSTPITILFNLHAQENPIDINFLTAYSVEIKILNVPLATAVLITPNSDATATNVGPLTSIISYTNPSTPLSKISITLTGSSVTAFGYNPLVDTNYFRFYPNRMAYTDSKVLTTQVFAQYGHSALADLLSYTVNEDGSIDEELMGPYDYITNQHTLIKKHTAVGGASYSYEIRNTINSLGDDLAITDEIGDALLSGRILDGGISTWPEFSPAAIPLTPGTWEISYLGGYFVSMVGKYRIWIFGRLDSHTTGLGSFVDPPENPNQTGGQPSQEFIGDVAFGNPVLESTASALFAAVPYYTRPNTVVINVLRPDVLRFWAPYITDDIDQRGGSIVIGARKLSSLVGITVPSSLDQLIAVNNYLNNSFELPPLNVYSNMGNVGRNLARYIGVIFQTSIDTTFDTMSDITLTYPDGTTTKNPSSVRDVGFQLSEALFDTGSTTYPTGGYTLTVDNFTGSKQFFSLYDISNPEVEDNS